MNRRTFADHVKEWDERVGALEKWRQQMECDHCWCREAVGSLATFLDECCRCGATRRGPT